MSFTQFDESLGTNEIGGEHAVFTPALAKIQAGGGAVEAPVAHRSAARQYMLVGAVVAAGVGVLVFLRMQGVGAGLVSAGEDEVKIEYPIDAPTNVNTEKRQRDVLNALASSGAITQVPSDEIRQNPFRLQSITSSDEEVSEVGPEEIEVQKGPTPEEVRIAELDRLAATLELNTVISGRISLARVNGKTYRIGDTVAGEFRVIAINPDRTVEIMADETIYVLEMADR